LQREKQRTFKRGTGEGNVCELDDLQRLGAREFVKRTFQRRRTIGGRELLRPSECGGRIGAQPDASKSAQGIFTRGTSGDKGEASGGRRGIFARKSVE
jgi:hypothetical protein